MGRTIVDYLWKTPLCAVTYLAAIVVSGGAVVSFGLPLPTIPVDVNATLQICGLLVGCVLLALGLEPLANRIQGGRAARWLVLALFAYVCLGLNTAIEASIFTKFGGTAAMAVMPLVPCVLLALVITLLFPAPAPEASFEAKLREAAGVGWRARAWQVPAAILAFPVIYFVVGTPVGFLVADYYQQEASGLVLPGMTTIIGTQLVRGTLYLLASLPVAIAWSGSRGAFILVFGVAVFVFTGLFGMVQANWLPIEIRAIHAVEFLVDSMAYAYALAVLLGIPVGHRWPANPAGAARATPET
jgi:hypothetical protein